VTLAGLVACILATGHSAFAHEDSRVSIEKETMDPLAAGAVHLEFQLVDLKTRKILTDQELAVSHEKKLHLLIFDPALLEFRHEHPTFQKGKWMADSQLPINGKYWMWVQGQIAADSDDFSSEERFVVTGGKPENATPPVLTDTRTGRDGLSVASLPTTALRAKKQIMLNLTLSRSDGSSPNITPYLGALAHVVLVSANGEELVHVHPMATTLPNVLMLHTEFEVHGFYRAWIQFIDEGTLKIVPLALEVKS